MQLLQLGTTLPGIMRSFIVLKSNKYMSGFVYHIIVTITNSTSVKVNTGKDSKRHSCQLGPQTK